MTQPALDQSILFAALEGLEIQLQRIEHHIAIIQAILSGSTTSFSPTTSDTQIRPRRKFSAAARLKMALAQRRRYAAMRGESVAEQPETQKRSRKSTKQKKRMLSPEAIERIRAGVRKRMAAQRKQRAGGKKTASVR